MQENHVSGSFKRMEVISVGGRFYQKIDDAPWLVREPPPPPVPLDPPVGSKTKPRFENHAQLIETLTDKGRLVSIYETKSKSTSEEDGKEISKIRTSRYWFRDDGMLLKKVAELETAGDPKIVRSTTVYEYEGIKIEAPIP